jgi:hypothetical protein
MKARSRSISAGPAAATAKSVAASSASMCSCIRSASSACLLAMWL